MSQRAHSHLLSVSRAELPRLAKLITINGVITFPQRRSPDMFSFFVSTIIGQQLASKAADAIFSRVQLLADTRDLSLLELFDLRRRAALRACGLSNSKLETIVRVKGAISSGQLVEEALRDSDYEHVQSAVTRIKGLGKWSADMLTIFYLRNKDIFPDTDGAVMSAMGKLSYDCSQDAVEGFAPYRSYVALHLWRGLNSRNIELVV